MQGFPMDSHVTWTIDPDTGATMPEFDRAVTSEPLREYIKGVITNGVLPNPSNNLQVSAGTNGMTVLVNAGFCVIEGGLAIEPNTRTLEVTSADSTYDRIDTVVARWDSNDATRRVDLHIVRGVPASHPVRPTLTRNESIYELGLADVFVTKGVVTITNEKITDTRMESARCGICSSISEWDTTTIYQQVQADLKQFKASEQAAFMDWFDQMKDQLTEDAAGRLQTEVDDVRGQIHTNLLNPTLQTKTVNGVTITNNGDGTYTLSGTSTGWVILDVCTVDITEGVSYRFFGCPSGGSTSTYRMGLYMNDESSTTIIQDLGTGRNWVSDRTATLKVRIVMQPNYAISGSLVFKPMLTTDLSATYDDFVQYSGDGELNENVARINRDLSDIWNVIYPVGSIYMSVNSTSPATLFGGTWERIKDRFLLSSGDTYSAGSTGGEATHTLTEAEMPQHYHTVDAHSHGLNGHTHYINSQTVATTSNGGHNHFTMRNASSGNQPPFNTVYLQGTRGGDNNYILAGGSQDADSGYTSSIGGHQHNVTVGNTYTGGNSGSTTNASPNTNNKGSGSAHNNMPPYLAVNVWKRTS